MSHSKRVLVERNQATRVARRLHFYELRRLHALFLREDRKNSGAA